MQDVRWIQRFSNLKKAHERFRDGLSTANQRPLSDLEKQGLIQSFEFTHELAWNTLKDLLEYQGITGLLGSRDVVREAFSKGLISAGDQWMDMIKSRNLTSHTYNQKVADDIVHRIRTVYAKCFEELETKLASLT